MGIKPFARVGPPDLIEGQMAEQKDLLTTNRKALTINLDHGKYGTFAEIGAGQEVARVFFHAGGASGTIAKTISAYDMVFSDAIYGKAPRYVSKERLQLMLDHEYKLLIERLAAVRGDNTTFFVFADTVAAKSFKNNNEAHGWMGIRFQATPESGPERHHHARADVGQGERPRSRRPSGSSGRTSSTAHSITGTIPGNSSSRSWTT